MSSVLRNRSIVYFAILFVTLLMIAGLSTQTSLAAGIDWEWQNPLPQGHLLLGVSAADADNCWAVGVWGTILHTTNGGSTWTLQSSGTTTLLGGVSAVDASTAWAVGDGTILHTVNGGSTWMPQTSGTTEWLLGVFAIDVNTAWAVGDWGTILHTTDGGSTWTPQSSGTTEWLRGVSAVDASNVWAVGVGGTIFHTTDGGSTWTPQTSGTTEWLNGVSAADANNCWAVGRNGTILHTTDGGSIWTRQTSGTTTLLGGVSAVDASTAWAVGDGTILHTTDGGSIWTRQTSGTTEWFCGVSAVNASNVWAVGVGGTIFHTTDGGSTWTPQSSGTTEWLRGVSAADASNCWAVGRNGTILHTTDGDSTWTRQTSGTTNNLNGVSAVDTSNCWAVGRNGTILHTTDGGSIWTLQTSGTTTLLGGVSAADANNCWAVGVGGTIFHTTDGGSTWTPQSSGTTNDLWGVSAVDASNAWAVGPSDTILLTTDGGSTWAPQTSGTTDDLYEVSAVDASNAWAVGGGGTILHTTDGGATWTRQTSGTTNNLNGVSAVDTSNCWAVGDWGTILHTTNGGSTWTPQSSGTFTSLRGVSAAGASNCWAVGTSGTILFGSQVEPTSRVCAHDSIGVTAPSDTWYLAEGATAGGFETWILIQNPNNDPTDVTLLYMTENGDVPGGTITLAPNSRESVNAGETVQTFNVSTKVTADQPVIAERAMYHNNRTCAHDSIGVTAPSDTWYLAEGATYGGFETWILIQNPNNDPTDVTLLYMTENGEVPGGTITLAPNSRESVNVGETVQTFNVSTKVTADQPVIAERAMYFTPASGVYRTCAHDSIGVTAPSDTWYLAEGATYGGFETWILIQNPNNDPTDVTLLYMTENGEVPGGTITLAPNSRESVNVGETVQTFKVSTEVTADQPVIAERAMYFTPASGVYRQCAHDSIGVTAPGDTWYLAEGATAGGFETWVLVQNPNNTPAQVTLTYMTENGEVPGGTITIPANSRESVNVGDTVQTFKVSTKVTADQPVIAERAMYGDAL